jgi:hypothetical protein
MPASASGPASTLGPRSGRRRCLRRRLGRPGAGPKQIARTRHELAKRLGIGKVARMTGLGTRNVHKLKREMGWERVDRPKQAGGGVD